VDLGQRTRKTISPRKKESSEDSSSTEKKGLFRRGNSSDCGVGEYKGKNWDKKKSGV